MATKGKPTDRVRQFRIEEIKKHCEEPIDFVRYDSRSRTERSDVSRFFMDREIVYVQ